ncbi:hypothetical protein ABIB06_002171 [Bradyrhizobium sp. LB8.2]|uniref:DUF1236 domain-containing protein n=1 Tax=unclassified Bradyrhizobium TaxID=2631580 RepID=UPI0033962BD9
MKTHLVVAATAVALASSVGIASAAEQGSTMSKMAQPSAMREMTKPGLSLTSAQQKLAWKDVERIAMAQKAPADFTPRVGATVPNDVALKPVPANLGRQVSTLKPYDYALLKHELLIVDPSSKKVVDVINRHA